MDQLTARTSATAAAAVETAAAAFRRGRAGSGLGTSGFGTTDRLQALIAAFTEVSHLAGIVAANERAI
jgi:hypothetical protein